MGLRICMSVGGKRRATAGMLPDKIYWARRDSARATRRTCFVANRFPLVCARF
ncbi:hypothetical protein KCP74_22340 [Salmonella enterica subsp. enterica]|nr:hypothetical protein KCP74_22340 [Salmonella enterica subsp. enterica]